MNLIVDIGNTNTRVSLFGGKCRPTASFPTKCKDYSKQVDKILKNNAEKIDQVGIASVVPERNIVWVGACRQYKLDCRFITAENNGILKINYSPVRSLGADRIAVAVGAISLYPRMDIVIIDAGTAVTVDAVSAAGKFLGGFIFPGLNSSLNALNISASLLPSIRFSKPYKKTGFSTKSCMLAGAFLQTAGGIEKAVEAIEKQYSMKRRTIIATGGSWKLLKSSIKYPVTYRKNLVLEGVNYWLRQ